MLQSSEKKGALTPGVRCLLRATRVVGDEEGRIAMYREPLPHRPITDTSLLISQASSLLNCSSSVQSFVCLLIFRVPFGDLNRKGLRHDYGLQVLCVESL